MIDYDNDDHDDNDDDDVNDGDDDDDDDDDDYEHIFSIISQRWDNACSGNTSSWKILLFPR